MGPEGFEAYGHGKNNGKGMRERHLWGDAIRATVRKRWRSDGLCRS
jgi:hypothetical protein